MGLALRWTNVGERWVCQCTPLSLTWEAMQQRQPWVIAVARPPGSSGFEPRQTPPQARYRGRLPLLLHLS